MDEAQHLADRVAILARGRIVAEGRPETLGDAARRTVIAFRLPEGADAERIGQEAGAPVHRTGNQATIESEHPQRVLYRLLRWAESQGMELEELSVSRPSLEDVFLSLTAGSPGQ
jgi:ABC-2 type transport system ATP-binding protein